MKVGVSWSACLFVRDRIGRHTRASVCEGNFPLLEFENRCIGSNNELSTDNAESDFSISLFPRVVSFCFRITFLKRPSGIAFDRLSSPLDESPFANGETVSSDL